MNRSSTALLEFVLGDDGATMAEYGFLILLVAAVCVGAVSLLGPSGTDACRSRVVMQLISSDVTMSEPRR